MKKSNYLKEILDCLKELNKEFPNQNICQHLALATAEYPQIEFISDKELSYLLKKYQGEKTLDIEGLIINLEDPYFNLEEEDY